MYLTIVRIFPNADEKNTIQGFLGALLRPVCVQLGCLGCTLARESDPDALVLIETWESEKDLVRRLQSDGFAKVLATMETSTKKPEVFIYEVVDQHGLESIEKVRMLPQEENPFA
ncbi:MAG: Antibiotic biosynthesis monooxygenase [Bacteroidetes bacterium]|jgi:quinol monooxygenase YgiN|nr:Antibiotic biosynthesis monooxygenase [Bacteroidota bacterium]